MNWAAFAISVGILASVCTILAARRGEGSTSGKWLAVPLLIVVCLNGAAPFRGLLDPAYMGYKFGLVGAERGWAVTLIAGSVAIGAFAAALIAVRKNSGPALWVVSGICAFLALDLAVPTLAKLLHEPASIAIELGSYARIPPLPSAIILLGGLSLPFAVGSIWAARGAVRRKARAR